MAVQNATGTGTGSVLLRYGSANPKNYKAPIHTGSLEAALWIISEPHIANSSTIRIIIKDNVLYN